MIGRDKNEGISDLLNTIFYLLYSTVEIPSIDVKKNADSLIENRKSQMMKKKVWEYDGGLTKGCELLRSTHLSIEWLLYVSI